MPTLGLGPKSPTDYTGWKTPIVPCVQFGRAPTTSDINYGLLTKWLDNANNDEYSLVAISSGLAQWRLIADGSSSGDITNFDVVDTAGAAAEVVGTGGSVAVTGGSGIRVEKAATSTMGIYNLKANAVTGTSQQMLIDSSYTADNAALVTITLPATAAVGTRQAVVGKGAGLWKIAQNASQVINFGSLATTTGVGGSITAIGRYDAITIECITANTTWAVIASVGNFTIV